MPFVYDYPRPMVTVDVALFSANDDGELEVLLIQRSHDPFAGRWALPGGFVDMDEELAAAARRELHEETGLRQRHVVPLGTYGKVGRDPRGRTISVVYLAACDRAKVRPRAGDDAAAVAWHRAARPPRLAFDHAQVVRDAGARLRELARRPQKFTRALFGARPPRSAAAVRRAARRGG